MRHPKTTPPRPYTPKKKPAPYLVPAAEKAISNGGGALIREDLEKVLMEVYAKSFPGFAKFAKTPSTAIRHSWPTAPAAPYGTMMIAAGREETTGMSLGGGDVYCFEHETIESDGEWTEADTE